MEKTVESPELYLKLAWGDGEPECPLLLREAAFIHHRTWSLRAHPHGAVLFLSEVRRFLSLQGSEVICNLPIFPLPVRQTPASTGQNFQKTSSPPLVVVGRQGSLLWGRRKETCHRAGSQVPCNVQTLSPVTVPTPAGRHVHFPLQRKRRQPGNPAQTHRVRRNATQQELQKHLKNKTCGLDLVEVKGKKR